MFSFLIFLLGGKHEREKYILYRQIIKIIATIFIYNFISSLNWKSTYERGKLFPNAQMQESQKIKITT